MGKFRKKPVEIEAIQFNGRSSIHEMEREWGHRFTEKSEFNDALGIFDIHTIEGTLRVSPGDWVVKGVIGEFYPCRPDIFEKTYDPV